MIMFMAGMLEQLDLALEQVAKPDVHYARFALMLTDNVVELYLHQMAKLKAEGWRGRLWPEEKYAHQTILDRALGRSFDDKIRLGRVEGHLDERTARTIDILHSYRNELYHVGLQHERILPALSKFYLDVACQLASGFDPPYWGRASSDVLPERSRKYLEPVPPLSGELSNLLTGGPAAFAKGCRKIAADCGHDPAVMIAALAQHMDDVVEEQDECLRILSQGVYVGQQRTRDRAVVDCQAWALASSDAGRRYLAEEGWTGTIGGGVDYVADHYPFKVRSDPIPSWRRQVDKLRARLNAHDALAYHHSFMVATQGFREMLDEAATAVDAEMDRAYESWRENQG